MTYLSLSDEFKITRRHAFAVLKERSGATLLGRIPAILFNPPNWRHPRFWRDLPQMLASVAGIAWLLADFCWKFYVCAPVEVAALKTIERLKR